MGFRWFNLSVFAVIAWLAQQRAVTAQLALIQVKMGPFQDCTDGQSSTTEAIKTFVMEQLSQGIRSQCSCGFNVSDFVTPILRCNTESPANPTFRAAVVDLPSTSTSNAIRSQILLDHAQTWVKSNPSIMSGVAAITVDSTCSISPGSFSDPPCSDASSGISVTVLVGALIVEFIVLCIIGFVAFAVFVAVFTSRKKMQRQRRKKYALHLPPPKKVNSLPSQEFTDSELRVHACPAYGASLNSSN